MLDEVGGVLLTTQPGPHARPTNLHARLTVALAAEADRARVVDSLPALVLNAEDLWHAADLLAADRSGERAAARSRADAVAANALHDVETARSQREQLETSRDGLIDGAVWAVELEAELPSLYAAAEAARAELEHHQAEQRSARHGLERVLEQRAAAAAAIEEADRELSELVGVGMDETGLRRELEASGQAVRSAQQVHAAAVARIEELRTEQASLEGRISGLHSTPDPTGHFVDPLLVDRVREWLTSWTTEAAASGVDAEALALATAWTDLRADLAELAQQTSPPPTEAELAAAEARAADATRKLERHAELAKPVSPAVRASLIAAHDAVLEAEERTNRRIGAAAARRRLEEAREAEQALLEEHGYANHLDMMLSSGQGAAETAARIAVERNYLAAIAERDALVAATQVSPELEYLESERARLYAHTVDLLGVDPGNEIIPLLRTHPLLPRRIVHGLRDALQNAGIQPIGVGLAEAAQRWVSEQDAAAEERDLLREGAGNTAVQRAAIAARQVSLVDDLVAAEAAEAHAAEQVELSLRSVGAFEAELSVRVGEDAQRLERFATAEQLRRQVEALGATLAKAESDARDALDSTGVQVSEAEVAVDRCVATLTDHTRHARRLASELPIDQRPEGDPLSTLGQLAERLRAHAEVLEPVILAAERALAKANAQLDAAADVVQGTSTGLEGPLAEDLRDALVTVLETHMARLLVLDDPFSGFDIELRHDLLELVVDRSAARQTVLLTEDSDLLGWAIELPADVATAVPADALLAVADLARSTTDPMSAAIPTSAPRWAGQR